MPQQNATHVVVTLEYAMPSPAKGRVRENVTVEIPTPSAQYAEGAAADIEIAAPVVVGSWALANSSHRRRQQQMLLQRR